MGECLAPMTGIREAKNGRDPPLTLDRNEKIRVGPRRTGVGRIRMMATANRTRECLRKHGAPGGIDSVGAQVDEVAIVTPFVEQLVSGYIDEYAGDVVVGGDVRVEVMRVANDACGFGGFA